MSRLILLIIGFVAGWFLKDSNWKEWLDSFKAKTPPQAPPKQISLQDEEVSQLSQTDEEVFVDELEELAGIGPASKAKLNENGIFTFAQVATLSSEELKEIAGARVKADAVIKQAQELAG